MTCSEFWLNVGANSLATLIAGTILGGILAYYINRISRKEERAILEIDLKISNATRSLDLLRFLKLETEEIIVLFSSNKTKIDDIGKMNYIRFNTSYWDVLKASGEIPNLFDPMCLAIFTNFYYELNRCNLLYEQFLDAENNDRANIELIIMSEYKEGIHSIQTMIETTKIDLIIDQVIESKCKELEILEMFKKNKRNHKIKEGTSTRNK